MSLYIKSKIHIYNAKKRFPCAKKHRGKYVTNRLSRLQPLLHFRFADAKVGIISELAKYLANYFRIKKYVVKHIV